MNHITVRNKQDGNEIVITLQPGMSEDFELVCESMDEMLERVRAIKRIKRLLELDQYCKRCHGFGVVMTEPEMLGDREGIYQCGECKGDGLRPIA